MWTPRGGGGGGDNGGRSSTKRGLRASRPSCKKWVLVLGRVSALGLELGLVPGMVPGLVPGREDRVLPRKGSCLYQDHKGSRPYQTHHSIHPWQLSIRIVSRSFLRNAEMHREETHTALRSQRRLGPALEHSMNSFHSPPRSRSCTTSPSRNARLTDAGR